MFGVVLGNGNGILTPRYKVRLEHAITKQENLDFLIVSGYGSEYPLAKTEAQAGFEFLRENGYEGEILIEDNSRSTIDNAVESFRLLLRNQKELKGEGALITDSVHMPRALQTFQDVVPSTTWTPLTAEYAGSRKVRAYESVARGWYGLRRKFVQ